MSEGWIKLHRSIKDWQHYQEPTVMLVWIDLLLSANAKDGWWKGKRVRRGELFTSVATICDNTGLDAKTVRKALDKLEATGEIRREATNAGSKIIINQFSKFQSSGNNPQQPPQPNPQQPPQPNPQQPPQPNPQQPPQPNPQQPPYQQEINNIINQEGNNNTPTPARAHEGVTPIFERPNPRMMDAKTYGTFQNVKLTDSEMQTLRMRLASEGHDEAFLQRCIDRLSAYMAQEGRSYNNHLAAILNWAKVAVLEDDRRTGAARHTAPNPASATPNEREAQLRQMWEKATEQERQEYLNAYGCLPWERETE